TEQAETEQAETEQAETPNVDEAAATPEAEAPGDAADVSETMPEEPETAAEDSEPEVSEPEVNEPEVAEQAEVTEVTEEPMPSDETGATDESEPEPVTEASEPNVSEDIIAALPKTEGTVGDLAPQVTTNRLPSLGSEPAADVDAPSALAPPPIERFAAPYTLEDDKPLMAIVLIDSGDNSLGVDALEAFPYPLTFAVDVSNPDAGERMQMYRDKGFEVLALVDLPRGATAADVEVAMSGYFAAVPEAVGILEGVKDGVQTSREMADQLTRIIQESGHGMVLQASGLNTARKLATREGIPAATVFRDFDGNGQSASVMRRFLDQAAFRAGQEGGVVMMGRLQAETISALLIWGLADRASRVSLVPVSVALTQKPPAQ
ncbi:MAG: divergent polysaccharide deacetylase family protein, partial [Planktotalea sp.]|uniref:divergent polysaccharide deacetylase family protein n=1 Tax=Planktotalea sp. TaxID=2029877 RepID=UPI003C70F661